MGFPRFPRFPNFGNFDLSRGTFFQHWKKVSRDSAKFPKLGNVGNLGNPCNRANEISVIFQKYEKLKIFRDKISTETDRLAKTESGWEFWEPA